MKFFYHAFLVLYLLLLNAILSKKIINLQRKYFILFIYEIRIYRNVLVMGGKAIDI